MKKKAKRTNTTKKASRAKGAKKKAAKRARPPRKAKKRKGPRVGVRAAAPRVALDAVIATDEEALKNELDGAIRAFNVQRAPLLKRAFDEGGDTAVAELERGQDALRKAFFELLQRQLDRNNAQFDELTRAAIQETAALTDAIERLEKIASIINRAASVVGMIGRVITVLGV